MALHIMNSKVKKSHDLFDDQWMTALPVRRQERHKQIFINQIHHNISFTLAMKMLGTSILRTHPSA
jgi:hypothetical protein